MGPGHFLRGDLVCRPDRSLEPVGVCLRRLVGARLGLGGLGISAVGSAPALCLVELVLDRRGLPKILLKIELI